MTEELDLKKQVDVKAVDLEEGFQQTPLQDFWAVLEDYQPENDTKFNRVNVNLMFAEVEVLKATEPYQFPIAQFSIPYKKKTNSAWGFLTKSIDKFIPGGSISSLVGRKSRWTLIRENYGKFGKDAVEDSYYNTWEITEVSGATAVKPATATVTTVAAPVKPTMSPYDTAVSLAIGKTMDSIGEFYQEAFKNSVVKSDKALLGLILNKTFIEDALTQGKLNIDETGKITKP